MYCKVILIYRRFEFTHSDRFSCEVAAGQDIDKVDGIDTTGFYIELGTAQVSSLLHLQIILIFKLLPF